MQKIKKKGYASKKQPEQEFMTITHRIYEFMTTYKKYIVLVSSAVVVVLVLVAGYAILRSVQEQKAAPLVAEAYEYYSPADGTTADYQKALTLFRGIQKKYPRTMSGEIAEYYVGNCLVNLGQLNEALTEYQQFIKTHTGEKFLLGLVYQRMGYALLELNKPEDAIKAWEQAESLSGPGVSTIELARLYEATGNILESQKKFKLVLDKLGGTTWAMEAMIKTQKTASATGAPKEVK